MGRWFSRRRVLYRQQADPADPLLDPLSADLTDLPPRLVQAGTAEVLLDDAARPAAQARNAEVEVTLDLWPDMIRSRQNFAMELEQGREALQRAGEWLSRTLG